MRDLQVETECEAWTNKLKNSAEFKGLILETGKFHAVIPLEGYRLSDNDYGKSIRTFYPNGSLLDLRFVMELAKGAQIADSNDNNDGFDSGSNAFDALTTFDMGMGAPTNDLI